MKTMTDKELSQHAGEVLQPEKNKHNYQMVGLNPYGTMCFCKNCGQKFSSPKDGNRLPCPSISLTWDNAMKWRDWAVENLPLYDVLQAFEYIANGLNYEYEDNGDWWKLCATPRHYIEAVVKCVENNKGE